MFGAFHFQKEKNEKIVFWLQMTTNELMTTQMTTNWTWLHNWLQTIEHDYKIGNKWLQTEHDYKVVTSDYKLLNMTTNWFEWLQIGNSWLQIIEHD